MLTDQEIGKEIKEIRSLIVEKKRANLKKSVRLTETILNRIITLESKLDSNQVEKLNQVIEIKTIREEQSLLLSDKKRRGVEEEEPVKLAKHARVYQISIDNENSRYNLLLDFLTIKNIDGPRNIAKINMVFDELRATFLSDSWYQNKSTFNSEAAKLVTRILFKCMDAYDGKGNTLINEILDTIIQKDLYKLLAKIIIKSTTLTFTDDPVKPVEISRMLMSILERLDCNQFRPKMKKMLRNNLSKYILDKKRTLWSEELEFGAENPIIIYMIHFLARIGITYDDIGADIFAQLKMIASSLDKVLDNDNPTYLSSLVPTEPKSSLFTGVHAFSLSVPLDAYAAGELTQEQRQCQNAFRIFQGSEVIPTWSSVIKSIEKEDTTFTSLLESLDTIDDQVMTTIRAIDPNKIYLYFAGIQSLICMKLRLEQVEIGESTTIDRHFFNLIYQQAKTAVLFSNLERPRPIGIFEGSPPGHHFGGRGDRDQVDGGPRGYCPFPYHQIQMAAIAKDGKKQLEIDFDINRQVESLPQEKYAQEIKRGELLEVWDVSLSGVYPGTYFDLPSIDMGSFKYKSIAMTGFREVEGCLKIRPILEDLFKWVENLGDAEATVQICLGLDSHIDEQSECSRPQAESYDELPDLLKGKLSSLTESAFDQARESWCFKDADYCALYGFIHRLKRLFPQVDVLFAKEGGYNTEVLQRHARLQNHILQYGFEGMNPHSNFVESLQEAISFVDKVFDDLERRHPQLS